MATPPDFTAGQVLQAASMNKIGLWLIKTQTIGSAVGTVTVNDAFSSDYENYKIVVTGGAGSGLTALTLRLGSTDTGYYSGLSQINYSTAAITGLSDNNAVRFFYMGLCTTNSLFMNADVFSPFLTKNTTVAAAYPTMSTSAAAGFASGFLNNSTSYTSFILGSGVQTMTGGTIFVYGYRM